MSEPEEVIIEAAHAVTGVAARVWRSQSRLARPDSLRLEDVRSRLEVVLHALFRHPFHLEPAEPPLAPNLFRRIAGRIPHHLARPALVAWNDGDRLALPPEIPRRAPGSDAPLARYRLLAIQQAARIRRGTAAVATRAPSLLTRDLFLLAEARAVDLALARDFPGLLGGLDAARSASARQIASERAAALSAPEQWLRQLRGEVLSKDAADPDGPIPVLASPEEALHWALDHTARAPDPDDYRGLPAVPIWGDVRAPSSIRGEPGEASPEGAASKRTTTLRRRPQVRPARPDEDDERPGIWGFPHDDPQESVEDPMGLQRPADRDADADTDDLADAFSDLPEARLIRTPGEPAEVLRGPAPLRLLRDAARTPAATGVAYPEWDYREESYVEPGAVVRIRDAGEIDADWAASALHRQRRLLLQVRRRFERLRLERVHIDRQPDGPDVDIAAYVRAFADQAAGGVVDDRFYRDVRRSRRELALMLLVDVSASTDSWVSGGQRIIDVEKDSLLLVAEALSALRERFAILSFSGAGPEHVVVRRIQDFDEPTGEAVHARIGGLHPERFTRVGAALRHATARLSREPARHRVLLLISDGKPNDDDVYETRYGVEDTRQAVAEARLQGIHPFCITVDRDASAYLPRMFGPDSYAVIRHPARLPHILVDFVRQLHTR